MSSLNLEDHEASFCFSLWVTHISLIFKLLLVPGRNTENSQDILSASFPHRLSKYKKGTRNYRIYLLCSNDSDSYDFLVLGMRSNDRRDLLICFD